MTPPSAVEPFAFRGRSYFVKRDDCIDPLLSGNKYRKLYTLLQIPSSDYDTVVSYGGTQSNAMLSIAALCRLKGWRFDYFSKPLPEHLRSDPDGNLKKALELGMNLLEQEQEAYVHRIAELKSSRRERVLVIPQGGADPLAQEGVSLLAEEIRAWKRREGIGSLRVVTPAGTGTTAYYLAAALPEATVATTAVVGDSDYLKTQMQLLGALPENLQILCSGTKHHFAKPYPELLALYMELLDAGLEVDLLYGAKMWYELLQGEMGAEETLLYIHSGGLIGNETMLKRYRYKGLYTPTESK